MLNGKPWCVQVVRKGFAAIFLHLGSGDAATMKMNLHHFAADVFVHVKTIHDLLGHT